MNATKEVVGRNGEIFKSILMKLTLLSYVTYNLLDATLRNRP